MNKERQKIGIYCQDDQHFHRGQKIKYLMVKNDKGSISKRLFCDECFLGNYNSYQQYCCNLQELINDRIYEAFKYTKFDSDYKQQYFNYARNHFPYQNKDFIENMVRSFEEEIISLIEDMKTKFLDQSQKYLEEVLKWTSNDRIQEYFGCDDFKMKLLDEKFERSPQNFEELNQLADNYVEKINKKDEVLKIDIDKIVDNQKQFFNLERFNNNFKEVMQTIQTMQDRTFTDYKFSQSTLATPYIEEIVKNISPEKEEKFFKDLKRIYRMTQHGSNYQTLQKIDQLLKYDTITIIQTKNKCIFGVYNCISKPEKSILFQMNKERIFQLQKTKKALQLNLQADLKSWILNIGEGDIVINSTFTKCYSNLGTGFDIKGTEIFNNKEYLSDCELFDIYDIEIFQTLTPEPQVIRKTPPNIPTFTTQNQNLNQNQQQQQQTQNQQQQQTNQTSNLTQSITSKNQIPNTIQSKPPNSGFQPLLNPIQTLQPPNQFNQK